MSVDIDKSVRYDIGRKFSIAIWIQHVDI